MATNCVKASHFLVGFKKPKIALGKSTFKYNWTQIAHKSIRDLIDLTAATVLSERICITNTTNTFSEASLYTHQVDNSVSEIFERLNSLPLPTKNLLSNLLSGTARPHSPGVFALLRHTTSPVYSNLNVYVLYKHELYIMDINFHEAHYVTFLDLLH